MAINLRKKEKVSEIRLKNKLISIIDSLEKKNKQLSHSILKINDVCMKVQNGEISGN